MYTCPTCGQLFIAEVTHVCEAPTLVKSKPAKTSDKSKLQVARESRMYDDNKSLVYCSRCNRGTDTDVIPMVGTACAFCWRQSEEPAYYRHWFKQRFIDAAAESRLKQKLDLDIHFQQVNPELEDADHKFIHHKSRSQIILRCITTVVREHNAPPPVTLILHALDDCYLAGRYQLDFLHWRKLMAVEIRNIYTTDRKATIKASQGRQTEQTKLELF